MTTNFSYIENLISPTEQPREEKIQRLISEVLHADHMCADILNSAKHLKQRYDDHSADAAKGRELLLELGVVIQPEGELGNERQRS